MRIENCLEKEVKLKQGITVDGKPFKSLIVREVIGFDEEDISQPAVRERISYMIIRLVTRCIAEVPGAERLPSELEVKKMAVGEIDTLLLAIRSVTVGDVIEYTAFCPITLGNDKVCKKPNEGSIAIAKLPWKKGEYILECDLTRGVTIGGKRCKKVMLTPPTGEIQEEILDSPIEDSNRGKLNTKLLAQCILSIDGEKVTEEIVSSMSQIDRKKLQDILQEFPGPKFNIEIRCKGCGGLFNYNINVLSFLL